MKNSQGIIDSISRKYGEAVKTARPRPNRIYADVEEKGLIDFATFIKEELKIEHISTITAYDTGAGFVVLYHFAKKNVMLTVRVALQQDKPAVDTIIAQFPGAVLYEQEVHELLGIGFRNHPDLKHLLLPDDWDKGYPLQKSWKV